MVYRSLILSLYSEQGMINLQDRIERMCYLGPEFIDITWGAGGSRPAATLEVVSTAQKVYGVETCMHLICTNNPTDNIDKALNVSFFSTIQLSHS